MTELTVPRSVVLSFDCLGLSAQNGAVERQACELVRLVAELGLSAAWSLPHPGRGPIGEAIRHTNSQELAIAAEAIWAGPQVSREAFSRELTSRTIAAGRQGVDISTLFVGPGASLIHLDVAARAGIIGVCGQPVCARRSLLARVWRQGDSSAPKPNLIRHGLWQLPITVRYPLADRFSLASVSRQTIRRVRDAIDAGAWLHVNVDVATVCLGGRGRMKSTERVLTYLMQRQIVGDITVASVRTAVAELSGQYRRSPAESILRRAA